MKTLKILTILLFIVIISYTGEALAVKLNPFDSSSLQPIPISNIRPNISENVNSNPETNKKIELKITPSDLSFQDVNQSSLASEEKKVSPYVIIWTTVSIIIIGLAVFSFAFLKLKKQ